MLTPHKEDPNRKKELDRSKKDPDYCIQSNNVRSQVESKPKDWTSSAERGLSKQKSEGVKKEKRNTKSKKTKTP